MKKIVCYAIIILILSFISLDIFLALMYLKVGDRLYSQTGFTLFTTHHGIIYLLCISLLVFYFRYERYRLCFWSGCLAALTNLTHTIILHKAFTKPGFENWYYISFTALQVGLLLFTASIITSASRERKWLKVFGITLLILQTTHVVIIIVYFCCADYQLQSTLSQVSFWLGLAANASFGLLIPNFTDEVSKLKSAHHFTLFHKISIGFLAFLVTYFSVYPGLQLYRQCITPSISRIPTAKETAVASRFEAHIFTNSKGDTLLYRLFLPFDYNPETKYPLALCLHHGGAHGNDNVVQVESSFAPFLSGYNMRRNHPSFLLVPQCPVAKSWWSPDIDLSITELMQSLEKQYRIDPKRRYVLGLSGGGYGSWHFIGNHPDLFAAAIPVCGKGDERLVKNMNDVEIWAFHGSEDQLVNVNESRKMVSALKKNGHNVRYTEFAGLGHNIDDQVRGTPGLWDWLFAQRRK
ncbi:carboxylesterase family protein [Dyadobacter luteus]|nr:prolyl oligopeptidase family serine peptidase [Dyadobacter luteus]